MRRQQLVARSCGGRSEAEKVRPGQGPGRCHPLQAEATATSNGVVLERMLVEKMPEIWGGRR